MSPRWVRVRPTRRDEVVAGLVAGALASGVAMVAFYVTRLFLSRRPLEAPGSVSAETVGDGRR